MSTTPDDISTEHPADIRSAWRRRPAASIFSMAPGLTSVQLRRSVVVWSWRPRGTHPRVASSVHVYREGGRLYAHASDSRRGTNAREESARSAIGSWAEVEAMVARLSTGASMVELGRVAP